MISKYDVMKFLGFFTVSIYLPVAVNSPMRQPATIQIAKNTVKDPKAGGLFSIHLIADINIQNGMPQRNPIATIFFSLVFISLLKIKIMGIIIKFLFQYLSIKINHFS